MATRKATTKTEHPLKDRVPSKDFKSEYVSRFFEDIRDLDLLRYAHEVQKPTLLFGDTGPGKTAMVMAYAAEFDLPLVTVNCNGGIDPNSFWGATIFDHGQQAPVWQDSEVTEVIQHGGVLYLDEVNFMPPKTSAVFHPLMDARRFVTIIEQGNRIVHGSPELFVIGAYNPGYEGTRPLNPAFKNRFKMKLEIDYDINVESKLVCMPVILELAKKLREARALGTITTPTSTNMLIEFEEFAADLGLQFAINNFLAAFAPEERDAVRTVIELHQHDMGLQLEQMIDG